MRRVGALLSTFLVATALLAPSMAAAATPLRVAVVDSETTFVNFAQLGWWTERPPRTAQVLANAGYTVVTARDADLENRTFLDSIDVLVLPLTRVMSPNASTTIRDWIADGGSVVAVFVSPRMLPRTGCVWTSSRHPRTLSNPQQYWTCPTPTNSDGGFLFWAREMNSAVYEYGPLSEAYQTIFINDPSPKTFSVLNEGTTHPILANTMASLGISGVRFDRPSGAGAEFTRVFNANATSILRFSIPDVSANSGSSQYDGYSAAQATRYGKGRLVYFDFDLLDFLPQLNAANAAQTYQGVTQGEIARELLVQSIDWTAQGDGTSALIDRRARTWAEIDVYSSGIYMRQYVKTVGNVGLVGDLHARIYDPSGKLVYQNTKSKIGVFPGGPDLRYSLPSYTPSGGLSSTGSYRIEVDYTYSYPGLDNVYVEQAEVVKAQGKGILTYPLLTGPLPERLAGPDRYATAVEISKATFSPGVPAVYIATGLNFPDALAAVPAAYQEGAPVLLTMTDAIPAVTREELTRLNPSRIVILGGTGAVSAGVASQLRAYAPTVVRRAGPTRFETAAEVSKAVFDPNIPVVYAVSGFNVPEALSAGVAAAVQGGSLLIVRPDSIPSAVKNELARLKPKRIVVVGDSVAVSGDVVTQLAAYTTGSVSRIEGSALYQAEAAVATDAFDPGIPVVYVARGDVFADGLAAGPAAALAGAPVLLVLPDSIPSATAAAITWLAPDRIVILGGPGAVSESVRTELALLIAR